MRVLYFHTILSQSKIILETEIWKFFVKSGETMKFENKRNNSQDRLNLNLAKYVLYINRFKLKAISVR